MKKVNNTFNDDKNDLQKTILNKSHSSLTITSKQVTFAKQNQNISHIFEGGDAVESYLESIVLQNSGLSLVRNHKILIRQDHEMMTDKVKVLSGGSARLEPLYSGFVGTGMLTASVFGEYSSSPSYLSILSALRLLARNNTVGILVIVMNNIADRLNFGLACHQASREGIKTMCLTVGEDCSGTSVDKTIGRRGLCGVLFLYKVAGAMSEDNKTLYETFSILKALKGGSLGSVNVGIERDGIVIGLGLRGEPGTFSQHRSIPLIIKEALFYIFHPASYFSLHVEKGDNIAVIINNLGKLSEFHLALIVKEVYNSITFLGINVARIYSGRFLTTKAEGFSVSVLKTNENVLRWLDSSACVICWPTKITEVVEVPMHFQNRCTSYFHKNDLSSLDSYDEMVLEDKMIGPRFSVEQANLVVCALEIILLAITNLEEYLNKLDFDHDYGTNIKKYMNAVKRALTDRDLNVTTPYGLFNNLAELATTSMGGVSGAVFSVIFSATAQAFLASSKYRQIEWSMWMDAAKMARDSLCAFTHVKPGYRTVVDSLHPFVEAFTSPTVICLSRAVRAAMQGAEETTTMAGVHKYPDPGAYCLAVILRVMFTELQIDLMSMEAETEVDELSYCNSCVRQMMSEGVSFCESCFRIPTDEAWYCGSCVEQMKLEGISFCESCLRVMEEE